LRLLLDTHVVLSWAGHEGRLSALADQQIDDASNQLLVSAVVVWEIAIKRALGKLRTPEGFVADLLESSATKLPISAEHAAGVEHLPPHHRDPFDRLLVSQATIEGATLVSSDEALRAYDVAVLW